MQRVCGVVVLTPSVGGWIFPFGSSLKRGHCRIWNHTANAVSLKVSDPSD